LRPLSLVVFGESGAGKSHLADTAPGPRLILDVEGGCGFTPSRKVPWDPRGPVPKLGPDDSAVVEITKFEDVDRAFQWLPTGKHPFRSVIIDSLTELQMRAIDMQVGASAQPQGQDWGAILRKVEAHVRGFRDLKMNPIKRIEVLAIVAGVKEKGQKDPTLRPLLTGQIAEKLAYHVDVQGFLTMKLNADGLLERSLQVVPVNNIAAKDRTGRLGTFVASPTIPLLQDLIYGTSRGEPAVTQENEGDS
jgi:hypothetical protein